MKFFTQISIPEVIFNCVCTMLWFIFVSLCCLALYALYIYSGLRKFTNQAGVTDDGVLLIVLVALWGILSILDWVRNSKLRQEL